MFRPFQSDTCSLFIPELELESGPRSLCGRFTTVEGLLSAMKEQLAGKDAVLAGDSADPETVSQFERWIVLTDLKYIIAICNGLK